MKRNPTRFEREALLARLVVTTNIIATYSRSRNFFTRVRLRALIVRRLLVDADALERAGFVRIAARVLEAEASWELPESNFEFASLPVLPPGRTPPRAAYAMPVPSTPTQTRAIPRSLGRRLEREV